MNDVSCSGSTQVGIEARVIETTGWGKWQTKRAFWGHERLLGRGAALTTEF